MNLKYATHFFGGETGKGWAVVKAIPEGYKAVQFFGHSADAKIRAEYKAHMLNNPEVK